MKRARLTKEQAIGLLGDRDDIHCIRNPGAGMMLGADRGREELINAINSSEGVEIGGEGCKSMGHGMVVWTDNRSPLFVEVDTEALNLFEVDQGEEDSTK